MIVTFRTKAHPDITMFGDVAVALLKLAGLSGTVPTALLATDLPDAIRRLEGGLPRVPAQPQEPTANPADDRDAEPPVPLQRRALPLLGLLRAADAAGADVMVEKS
jgi:uncharacterized protein DUF1840